MAEENKQETTDTKEPAGEKKSSSGMLVWLIMAVIIVVCAGSGLVLGKLFAKPQAKTVEANDQNSAQEKPKKKPAAKKAAGGHGGGHGGGESKGSTALNGSFYNLDPVVANINEPGATRYVRITLTLELDEEADIEAIAAIIEEKKPIITNWLTIYLASLSLDDIQGDKNLKRIQGQILDSFNEKLLSGHDSKPVIKSILFKEFAIQ
ncbi:MAG: flagellar basal body-associated FliL family protein [Sedimentisphaerales bacterium]